MYSTTNMLWTFKRKWCWSQVHSKTTCLVTWVVVNKAAREREMTGAAVAVSRGERLKTTWRCFALRENLFAPRGGRTNGIVGMRSRGCLVRSPRSRSLSSAGWRHSVFCRGCSPSCSVYLLQSTVNASRDFLFRNSLDETILLMDLAKILI